MTGSLIMGWIVMDLSWTHYINSKLLWPGKFGPQLEQSTDVSEYRMMTLILSPPSAKKTEQKLSSLILVVDSYLGSDLVSALAGLNVNNFPHCLSNNGTRTTQEYSTTKRAARPSRRNRAAMTTGEQQG